MSDVGLLAVLGVMHLLAISCGAVLVVPLLLADRCSSDDDGPEYGGSGWSPGPGAPEPVPPRPPGFGPPLPASVPSATRLREPAPLRRRPLRRRRPAHPSPAPSPTVAR